MVLINVLIDTDKKSISAAIDGQDIGEIEDINAYKYNYTRHGDEPEEDRKMTSFSISLFRASSGVIYQSKTTNVQGLERIYDEPVENT